MEAQVPLPLITRAELSPSWLLPYAVTFALQAMCAGFRAFVAYPVLWLAFTLLHWPKSPLHLIVLAIAYGPLALSLATLILPAGGWLWQQRIGARTPSQREQAIFAQAFAELRNCDPTLRPPPRWCVQDAAEPNAAVYADTLMLTRGLLESSYLTAVLAHELGHLNTSDARLTAVLVRMTTPPRTQLRKPLRTIALVATGAATAWATRVPWAAYWRTREYAADAYAARLGQSQPLALFLDAEALEHDLAVPFAWLRDGSHPPTEHRLERIEHLRARG
ncbi:MAG TPA: M48 family metalloprotease [Solirubrobacteraceae bacterium]|jgi:Zn-dependent protease with chaperone function